MKLSLYQFKHYTEKTLELGENLQVVIGNNGSGKSTLCEAMNILINASNPHHTSWEEKVSFANLSPTLSKGEGEEKNSDKLPLPSGGGKGVGLSGEWALRLQLGETLFQSLFDGKNRAPKWHLDEEPSSKPKYEDRMSYRAFWIQSDHLRIISGEPSERRNFLDEMLVFASPSYEKILRNYRTALTSRNRVIQSILDKEATKSDLSSWDTLLADYAVQVIHERRKFFEWFNFPSFQPIPPEAGASLPAGRQGGIQSETVSDGLDPRVSASLRPRMTESRLGNTLNLPGPVSVTLSEHHPLTEVTQANFLKLLREYTERDLVVGRTTVGPHLDEIAFSVEINNTWSSTKYILSRGENKILLLAFIRLLGKYVREISGKNPLFLLDDVLSELDTDHIQILCQLFEGTTTIMTTQPNHTAGLPTNIAKIEL